MELFFKKNNKIIICFFTTLSLFLVLFHFTDTPRVWFDEGVFTEVSRNLAYHGVLGLQTSPGIISPIRGFILSTSYPVIFPVALSFKLFNVGIWQARLPMVFYMLLFLLVSYLFVRKKYGNFYALFSLLLLLSFSPFYGNGRPVQGEVPGLFYLILGLYILSFLEDSNFLNKKWAIFSGLAFGLSAATKALFLTFLTPALILIIFLEFRRNKDKKNIYYFIVGYIVPLILWYFVHFFHFGSIKEIFSSYLYLSGSHNSLPLYKVFLDNFLRFFTESTPILFLVLGLSAYTFLGFKYKKDKTTVSYGEIILVVFIFLNFLGYLKGTGWYRYFFPAHILLYLLFPVSILNLSSFLKNFYIKKALSCSVFILIVFQFYHLFFLSDTSYTVTRTRNSYLATTLNNIPKDKKILFYNTAEAIVFWNGKNYSQYSAIENFLTAGEPNSINSNIFDYILTDTNPSGNLNLSCYQSKQVSRYYLLTKIISC
jgi:4-amino-4-deoxy-L-arabinose transferase-like glycosyltransferase